jgi:hypothetical protein
MRRYKYMVEEIKLDPGYETLEEHLNKSSLVKAGWRIVSVINDNDFYYQVVFEKPETDG